LVSCPPVSRETVAVLRQQAAAQLTEQQMLGG
jgi:hypothetical protein